MELDEPSPKRRRTSTNSQSDNASDRSRPPSDRERVPASRGSSAGRTYSRTNSGDGGRTDQERSGRRSRSWSTHSADSRRRPSQDYTTSEEQTPQFHSPSRSSSSSSFDRRRPRALSPTPPPRSTKHLQFRPVANGTVRGHARGITCVRFSPSGEFLASASADATIKIYSTTTPFTLLKTLTGHLAGVNVLAWSPDSLTIASGSDDKAIRLWDIATGRAHPVPLLGHHNYVYSLAFSPRGNMLVSGSYDEAVFLWNIRPSGGIVMRSLPAHSDPVSGVDFIQDGTMVCSCAGDGLIRIWDAMTGQCLKTLVDEDRKPVSSVRWTANGKYVLAWTLDGCVRLWDYREGRCVKTYQGHVNEKYSLSGATGTYTTGEKQEAFVASGSEDGEVVVWDVSTKEILWREKAHDQVVLSLDFYRIKDGNGILASAGLDRSIRIWSTAEETEKARLVNGGYVNSAEPDIRQLSLNGPDTLVNGVPNQMT